MGTKKTHTHSQVRTKLNQEAREHRGLLTQLIALDSLYSNHPLGESASKGGWSVDPAHKAAYQVGFSSSGHEQPCRRRFNSLDTEKRQSITCHNLLIINLCPSISLLLPHISGGNFGKQLKTGFSSRVRE